MPDNPIAGLYPQAPQPGGILGGNPLQALSAISMLNANARFNAEFGAKKAVGQAFQNALQPDGTVDINRLTTGLQNPAAAYAAPEAIGSMLSQRGQMIANDTNQFKLNAATNGATQDFIAGLAGNPNITHDDVLNGLVEYARRNPQIPSTQILSLIRTLPNTGKSSDIQAWARTFQNIQAGPAVTIQRTQGPPSETGAPTTQPLGQANLAGGTPTAMGPEEQAGRTALVADQQKSPAMLAGTRQLSTALPIIQNLSASNFGPGSEGLAKLKGVLVTAGVMDPNDTSLPDRQVVNKYLHQYVGMSRGADRSDQGLSQALASNPNLDLTQPATLQLVKNQIALDRQDAALPVAFKNENPGPAGDAKYLDYKNKYYQNTDLRAFKFDMMTPKERANLQKELGPPSAPGKPNPAYDKFVRSYQLAKSAGLFAPPPQGQ